MWSMLLFIFFFIKFLMGLLYKHFLNTISDTLINHDKTYIVKLIYVMNSYVLCKFLIMHI